MKLRFNKTTGRYLVVIQGKSLYLGRDRASAEVKYLRLLAEYKETGTVSHPNLPITPTIDELVRKYLDTKSVYYRHDCRSMNRIVRAMDLLREALGPIRAENMDIPRLDVVRDKAIARSICRNEVNRIASEIVKMFKWCASQSLVSPDVWKTLETIEPLRRGHCDAAETEAVKPVSIDHIRIVQSRIGPLYADIMELQLLTGARPGEILSLSGTDIDRTDSVWIARLQSHKNAHRGIPRTLYFGLAGQEILRRHMLTTGLLFPVALNSYRKAISRCCKQAGITSFSPNQIRHTAATHLRSLHGIEMAKLVLGHTTITSTQIYAERDENLIKQIARRHM